MPSFGAKSRPLIAFLTLIHDRALRNPDPPRLTQAGTHASARITA